jgi:hypothetical protein
VEWAVKINILFAFVIQPTARRCFCEHVFGASYGQFDVPFHIVGQEIRISDFVLSFSLVVWNIFLV